MPGAVTQKDVRLYGLAIAQAVCQLTRFATGSWITFVQANQKFFPAMSPNNILGQVSTDSFRSPVPKDHLQVAIDHIDANGQALKNSPKDFWVLHHRLTGIAQKSIG